MPTSATNTYTFSRVDPLFNPQGAMESMLHVKIAASQTLAAGTVIGEVTASPGTYKAYASGNVDGTQNPTGILQYAVTTDGSSNITNYSEWGFTGLTAPMYTRGYFRTQDLVGLDANAVTKLGGHLVEGSVTTGIVNF